MFWFACSASKCRGRRRSYDRKGESETQAFLEGAAGGPQRRFRRHEGFGRQRRGGLGVGNVFRPTISLSRRAAFANGSEKTLSFKSVSSKMALRAAS